MSSVNVLSWAVFTVACLILGFPIQSQSFRLGSTLSNDKVEREPVQIQVGGPHSPSSHQTSPLLVQFTAFGKDVQLHLSRPNVSIFTDGFTYGTASVHKKDLERVEKDVYVDVEGRAVVKLDVTKGAPLITGFVNGMGIDHVDGQHFISRETLDLFNRGSSDYVVVPEEDQTRDEFRSNVVDPSKPKPTAGAVLEVVAVIDKSLAGLMGNSQSQITSYAAIMFHTVNVIYADMVDPTLQAKLAGILLLNETADTEIVQKPETASTMLAALKTWVGTSPAGLGPNDHVALITAVPLFDNSGNPSVAGIAYIASTCSPFKVSVSSDPGAFWMRVFTLAHEMAHNMAAYHDFDTPCGSEGYLMDYNRNTSRAYYFSACSKQSIRERLSTTAGSCLLTEDAGAGVGLGNQDGGDLMPFAGQCVLRLKEMDPTYTFYQYLVSDNPSETACVKMTCRFKKLDGSVWLASFTFPAEGTSCNQSGGRCRRGLCL